MCPNVTSFFDFRLFFCLSIYPSVCKKKEDIDMTEIKVLKLEPKFNGTKDLYNYLVKNAGFIDKCIGIQIQKPLKDLHFCIIGQEKITEKKILFYASKADVIDSFGELIILASQSDSYIIVIFLPKISISWLDSINWLQKISVEDYEFIICETNF